MDRLYELVVACNQLPPQPDHNRAVPVVVRSRIQERLDWLAVVGNQLPEGHQLLVDAQSWGGEAFALEAEKLGSVIQQRLDLTEANNLMITENVDITGQYHFTESDVDTEDSTGLTALFLAAKNGTGDVVAPALEQLCLEAPKHEEPATTATNLHTESADHTPENDEPSLDESGAKDSSSESSLYEAEEVCDETPRQPGGKSKTEARITKQESSQAEKDRFILSRFDLFAESWKRTLDLFSGESHEYSGKGMKPVQDAHTEQTVVEEDPNDVILKYPKVGSVLK